MEELEIWMLITVLPVSVCGLQERRKEADGVEGYRRVVPAASTEEILWDWQVASLLLAIIGCLLFLLAAACVALNQSRQWRRIEKHFDAGR